MARPPELPCGCPGGGWDAGSVRHVCRTSSTEARVLQIRKPSLPAWLLSVVVHMAALLLLAFIVRPPVASQPLEPQREVGIALVRNNHPEHVEYFDAEDAPRDTPNAAPLSPDSPNSLAAALPAPGGTPHELPIAALPELPGRAFGDVTGPTLQVTPLHRQPLFPGTDDEAILAEEAARKAAAAVNRGPQTSLQIFGSRAAVGNSFVFVIDRSKSMGGEGLGALDAAGEELTTALARLEPAHRFQVIAYHRQPVYLGQRRLLDATPENKQALQTFFNELVAYGATEHETALLSALRLEPDVIFLLTDGGDPYLSDGQIERIVRRADGRTAIHCLQFGFGPQPPSNDFMPKLARRCHGGYTYINMTSPTAKTRGAGF